jgi:PKD repeat protein
MESIKTIELLSNYFEGHAGGYQSVYIYNMTGLNISKNRVISDGIDSRGIAIYNAKCTKTNPGLISNNFISAGPDKYNSFAFLSISSSNINFYNNTLLLRNADTSSDKYPMNKYVAYLGYGTSNFNLKNNIFLNRGNDTVAGTCLYVDDPTQIKSDNNDFYMGKGGTVIFETASPAKKYSSLLSWQSSTKLDSNSIYTDPMLITPDDVFVKNKKLAGAGKNLAPVVVDDINGAKRPNTPAIGAIEPTFIYNDAGITAFAMDSVICEGSNNIIATIKNYGLNPLKSATTHWMINNSSATSGTYAYSGSIITGKTANAPIGANTFKPGIYNLKSWLTKPNGVTDSVWHDTIYFQIHVLAKPVSKISGSSSVCVNSSASYSTAKNNGNKYLWLLKGKGTIANATSDTATISFSNPGMDTVIVVETNTSGCSDSAYFTVTVNPLPKAKWAASKACLGNAIHFTDSSSLAKSYTWLFGDGSTDSTSNPSHTYAKAGSYNVTLKIKSVGGCEDSISHTVVVNVPPKAGFSYNQQCQGDSTIFTDSSISAVAYVWHFGDGDSSLSAKPKHKFAKAGAYRVRLSIISSGGCTDSISRIVAINGRPKAGFAFSGVCISDSTSFKDSSVPVKNYSWHFGDGNTSTASSPKHKYASVGKYLVTLITTNASGCTDSISKYVTIDSSCVWPGDANADKIVNVKDVLAIGIAYSDTGSKRADTSTTWSAHICKDWSGSFLSGRNYKNADCNGDGIVNSLDTNTISRNYSKTHPKTGFLEQGDPTDPAFNIVFEKSKYSEGDTIVADVYLGNSTRQVSNAYGLAFSLNYDPTLIQSGNMTVDFSNSWLGTKGTNLIFYSKNHFSNGQLDLAIVRTDHKNVSGYGKIGTISLLVAKTLIDSNKTFSLSLSDNKLVSFNETVIPVYTYSDTTQVQQKKVGLAEPVITDNSLRVFPNPFSSTANIVYSLQGNEPVQLAVFDMNGNVVSTLVNSLQPAGRYTISFDASQYNMPSGIYYVKFIAGNKLRIQKLILTK